MLRYIGDESIRVGEKKKIVLEMIIYIEKRVKPVLVSPSDLYSLLDSISVSTSRPFSSLTSYHLLTTYFY